MPEPAPSAFSPGTPSEAQPAAATWVQRPPERPSERPPERSAKRGFLRRLAEHLHPGPDSTEELIESLGTAQQRQVIGADSRAMIEGVLHLVDKTVADVMVAAPRVDAVNITSPIEDLLKHVIHSGHSRFPVFENDPDNIIGMLLAKDLLKLQRAPELNLRTLLRPAVFVPESKSLSDLLREFLDRRYHLALAVDEYGRVAGLITIEDVLEEIVGEIEDEHDRVSEPDGIIFSQGDGVHRVSGDTPIARINQHFGVQLPEDEFDTIGGLLAHRMGHVPRRGEQFCLHSDKGNGNGHGNSDAATSSDLQVRVLHTRAGAIQWLRVQVESPAPPKQPNDASR